MTTSIKNDETRNPTGIWRPFSQLSLLTALLFTLGFPLTSIAESGHTRSIDGGDDSASAASPLCPRGSDGRGGRGARRRSSASSDRSGDIASSNTSGDIPKNCPSAKKFSFAAVGDQDYDGEATFQRLYGVPERHQRDPSDYNQAWLDIIDDINAKNTPFAIHVGDIMLPFPIIDPSEDAPFPSVDICNATDLANRRARMEQLNAVVLTPGDNEWAECFQDPMLQIGGWPLDTSITGPGVPPADEVNPLEMLDTLIAEFYPDPNKSMGKFPLNVERQPNYPENARFLYGKVMYVNMHIVGGLLFQSRPSNALWQVTQIDGCPINVYTPGGTPNPIFLNNDGTGRADLWFDVPLVYPDEADGGTPINPLRKENGELDCTDQENRQAANIAWLKDAYSKAEDSGARAMVISFHANLHLLEDGVNVVDNERREFFQPYVNALREEALSFPIPTLHIYGDAHTFTVDKPYKITENGDTIENVMRLQVFGPTRSWGRPQVRWVQVHTDTTRRAVKQGVDKVFTFSVCNVNTGRCPLRP
jgi:hypothetical protein